MSIVLCFSSTRKGVKSSQHSPAGSIASTVSSLIAPAKSSKSPSPIPESETVRIMQSSHPAFTFLHLLCPPNVDLFKVTLLSFVKHLYFFPQASLTHQLNQSSEVVDPEVDGLFKKSVRRVHKISGSFLDPAPSHWMPSQRLSDYHRPLPHLLGCRPTSTLDLRGDGASTKVGSMGDRSKSVPGLNVTVRSFSCSHHIHVTSTTDHP